MSKEIASEEQIKHWARQLNGDKPTYEQLQEHISEAQATTLASSLQSAKVKNGN